MKNTVHIVLSLTACMFVWQVGYLYADSVDTREYEMKAAYIYNILKFVELSEIKRTHEKGKEIKTVSVGVTDKDILLIFQDVLGNKEILQRKEQYRIAVKYVDVKQLADENNKPKLDVLFIKDTTRYDPQEIFSVCVKNGILTVGETEGFLESGGVVNFVIIKNKLKFEVNMGIAEQAGIKIRSQLLKLANKVIDEKMLP